VIRFAPPLTITCELIDRAVEVVTAVLVEKSRERAEACRAPSGAGALEPA